MFAVVTGGSGSGKSAFAEAVGAEVRGRAENLSGYYDVL